MLNYRYVGWFSDDPNNTERAPIPVTGVVGASSKEVAFRLAYDILYEERNGRELLNWYVRDEK